MTVDQECRQLDVGVRRRAVVILTGFAIVWAMAGSTGIAVALCLAVGELRVLPMATCLIVAVHFLPLARVFDQPQYRWTAVGLFAVSTSGLLLVPAGHAGPAAAVVGFGGLVWMRL